MVSSLMVGQCLQVMGHMNVPLPRWWDSVLLQAAIQKHRPLYPRRKGRFDETRQTLRESWTMFLTSDAQFCFCLQHHQVSPCDSPSEEPDVVLQSISCPSQAPAGLLVTITRPSIAPDTQSQVLAAMCYQSGIEGAPPWPGWFSMAPRASWWDGGHICNRHSKIRRQMGTAEVPVVRRQSSNGNLS